MDEVEAKRERARAAVRVWINAELYNYTDHQPKADVHDRHHTEWDESNAAWWESLTLNYMSRAKVLREDDPANPAALQMTLKALTTSFEMAVTAIVAGCPMPAPGAPSGEIDIMEIAL